MVSLFGPLLLVLALPSADPTAGHAEGVRPALRQGEFPWYDATTGRVKPLLSQPDYGSGVWKRVGDAFTAFGDWLKRPFRWLWGWVRWLNFWRLPGVGGLGNVVAVGIVLLVFTLVLVGLLELLRRYRPPEADAVTTSAAGPGRAARFEGLPAGVRFDAADPWEEARRLRGLGDYAGAVVYLFAHQLLALERARQLRLVPGRTGRQLVRSVADRTLGAAVEPTLRMFEAVYYGQKAPTVEAFEAVWAQVEAFERALAPHTAGAAS